MAVRTHDFALRDLVVERLFTTISNAARNVERLVTEVIELENGYVGFPAVHARMRGKVIKKELHPLGQDLLRAPLSDLISALSHTLTNVAAISPSDPGGVTGSAAPSVLG